MQKLDFKYRFYGDKNKVTNKEFLGIFSSRNLTDYSIKVFEEIVLKFQNEFVFFLTFEAFKRLDGMKVVKKAQDAVFCLIYETKYWNLRVQSSKITEILLDTDVEDSKLKYLLKDIFIVEKVSKIMILEATIFSKNLEIITLYADQKGKKVYSLPGRIDSSASAGTNKLIYDGVMPLFSLDLLKM